MDLVDELLDDRFLLLQEPSEFFDLLAFGLDVEIVGLLLHEGICTLLPAALLRLQPLLSPVSFEHALLEEGFLGLVFDHFSALAVEVCGVAVVASADFEGRMSPALSVELLQLELLVLEVAFQLSDFDSEVVDFS